MIDVMIARAEQAAVEADLRRAAAHHGYEPAGRRLGRRTWRGRSRLARNEPTAA